jgi:hypothetical protein
VGSYELLVWLIRERDTPDQTPQPAARVAGRPAISVGGQRDQAVPEAGAVNDAAVAAYQLSAQAGNPLSERKLAGMFGRTSRRQARARIAEARRVPPSGLSEDLAATIGAHSPTLADADQPLERESLTAVTPEPQQWHTADAPLNFQPYSGERQTETDGRLPPG